MLALLAVTASAATLEVQNGLASDLLLTVDGSRAYVVRDEDSTTFLVPPRGQVATLTDADSGCLLGSWDLEGDLVVSVEQGCDGAAGVRSLPGFLRSLEADQRALAEELFGERAVRVKLGPPPAVVIVVE